MSALRFASTLAVAFMAIAVLPSSGLTQHIPGLSIGIHGAYNFNDAHSGSGVHALIDLSPRFALYPGYQTYQAATGRLWRMSTTLRWMPRSTPFFRPYVALGPYLSRLSAPGDRYDWGVLAQVGGEGRGRRLRPFAELVILKDGAVSTEVAAGARFVLVTLP